MEEQAATDWLALMARVQSIRSGLYYSRRNLFDEELRPFMATGSRVAYPAAIYHITAEDVERAAAAAVVGETQCRST